MNETVLIFIFHRLSSLFELTEGFFFMKCIDCCLKRRSGTLAFLAGLAGYSVVSSIIIFPDDMVNISLALLVFALLNFFLYQGPWIIKLSLIIILLPISSALNLLVFDITGTLYFQYFTGADTLPNAFFSSMSGILPAAFFAAFYRFCHGTLEKMRNIFTKDAWYMTDVICAASFAGVFSCIYLAPEHAAYYIWPCMLACIVTNVGSIRLASYLADGIHADLERKNLRLQKNYYEELERSQNQIRKIRHDMNSHLAVVGELLKKGDAEKAEAYFAQISDSIQSANRKFCKNSVVNAVLNARYSLMLESQIDGFFHISIDGMMFIDDVSLCTIFANTLDNAVEACRKIESIQERFIQLKCRYTENGYFSFELINSRQNEIVVKKGQFVTDKEDRRMHGIGISSVKGIVEKYEGVLDISYDTGVFKVVILIGDMPVHALRDR